ncbi:MAG: hypothetical protein CBD76_03160 [Pelagibacteraceae bacterium TMED216]|nr:MAG: hypothetical protein CBD76_03160 [Pelagibacteraceae bacterium TMED216]|tara:strand:- start:3248 stop:3868 length:621 start_codon:yes stop_codon:yes gene_type:complete
MKSSKYWDFFYKKKGLTNKNSNFSKFISIRNKNKNNIIYDIGCGNARDTLFFNKKKYNCYGIDRSKAVISKNKKRYKKIKDKFINKNFCTFFNKKINKNFSVYSRFTLHSINYKDEDKLFKSLQKQNNLVNLFIETRTLKDNLYGVGKKVGKHEYISSHYRRFIDPKVIKKKLKKVFTIVYFKQGINFAKYKKENPWVLRIIAKKK